MGAFPKSKHDCDEKSRRGEIIKRSVGNGVEKKQKESGEKIIYQVLRAGRKCSQKEGAPIKELAKSTAEIRVWGEDRKG